MFFSALLFASLNPDDGSCALITNERDCIYEQSAYIQDKSKCMWYHSLSTSCVFRQPDQLANTIVLVVIVASLLSIPIARIIEYILIKLSIPDQNTNTTTTNQSSTSTSANTLTVSGTNTNQWSIFKPFQITPTNNNNISRGNTNNGKVTPFDEANTNIDYFRSTSNDNDSYDGINNTNLINDKQRLYISDHLLVYFGFQIPIRLQSVNFIDGITIYISLYISICIYPYM